MYRLWSRFSEVTWGAGGEWVTYVISSFVVGLVYILGGSLLLTLLVRMGDHAQSRLASRVALAGVLILGVPLLVTCAIGVLAILSAVLIPFVTFFLRVDYSQLGFLVLGMTIVIGALTLLGFVFKK